jgi:hypothetical protein
MSNQIRFIRALIVALHVAAFSLVGDAATVSRGATHECSASEADRDAILFTCRKEMVRCGAGGKHYCCTGNVCEEAPKPPVKRPNMNPGFGAAATASDASSGGKLQAPPQTITPRLPASGIYMPPKTFKP